MHSDTIVPESGIFDCVNFLDEFRSVNKREGCGLAKFSNTHCWKASIASSFKINTDVDLNIGSKVSSVGVVIRDWKSKVMASLC